MAFFDLKPSSSCSSWDWESSSGVYSQPRGGVVAGGGGFEGFPWSSSQSDDLQSNNGGDGFLALAAIARPSAEEFCRNESSSVIKAEQEVRGGGGDEGQEQDPLSVCLKLGGKSRSGGGCGGAVTFAFSEEASSTPALSSSNNNAGRKEEVASLSTSLSPSLSPSSSMHLPVKKARSGSTQIPRCQVEGCREDLSPAKEYHRRHKVCSLHSKATSVIVVGLEQRFCQQCSRFHLLAEFDDGKRSCRKRLAGHNERRRKPQPDPLMYSPFFKGGSTGLPFLSSSSSSSSLSFSWDDKFNFRPPGGHEIWSRTHNSDSGNRHQSMINFSSESSWMAQSHSPPSFLPNCSQKINNHHNNNDGNGSVEPPLLLLPSTKESTPSSNNGILLGQYLRHPYPTTSQGLTLSFSGGAEMHSGMEALTRASDTVCALSLQHPPRSKDSFQQSNSSNNNNNSNSNHHLAFNPLLLHEASQGSSICPSEQSPLIVPSLPFDLAITGGGKINNILSSSSSSSSSFHLDSNVSTTLGLLNNQGGGNSSIRDFDGGNPFFSMHGNGIGGDDNRPTTIDLMRLSSSYSAFSPESSSMVQIAAGQFGEFQALHHSYESSLFDPQQFMQ